ncbi:hypothetical protein F383_30464 [Gossypium arboreum]|uniref:Uncharacterized protein n=1 Tax=Gossypium arboreum TaxID=29729 RepID=A0A0B0MYD1_GOSAR|nr:hypothetical protein F383_30464 [Gossypium arboreum]
MGLELCYVISLFVYGLLSFGKLILYVFSIVFRYRSYQKLGDHRGSSPLYQTYLWYLIKV